ncbi:Maleylacetate reductase [Corynebacterium guangdongense]|uniref:Alcohol dehydrogenase class IV n=1 Tax=Corynebacterium guangdongense TaxID=1783348 RepID=A0ABU1ZTZ1_9CORY|nr:maleylacetate reductase [Corynebacterium guangdongense]MDR7328395.1 alcohol dehydrogenase class IV [Corynebacterium guangdongense]WJZ16972.1 Maleylacetate reductase [Corynebacterium guangdongense]
MTELNFDHDLRAQRVLFGAGRAAGNVAQALADLGVDNPMLIASEHEAELAAAVTADVNVAAHVDEVVMHVPVEVAERARKAAEGVDSLISVGGGSTTGLAKAVALTTGLPIVAVPTTYAGSEATAVWGMTENRTKTTGSDGKVLPRAVVYDPGLLATLPADMAIASGLNAMAHCVDSLWAPKADPINRAHALEGARLLRDGLAGIRTDSTPQSRELTLAGCYLAALSFSSAGSGLHHKICHVLGGTFDLPHAETHATVLPHVLAFNVAAGADAHVDRLAEVFGTASAAEGLSALYEAIDAPNSLAAIGFTEADIPEAVERILAATPVSNPVTVTEENMTELLRGAL